MEIVLNINGSDYYTPPAGKRLERRAILQGYSNSEGKSPVHLSVTGNAGHAQMDGTFALTV